MIKLSAVVWLGLFINTVTSFFFPAVSRLGFYRVRARHDSTQCPVGSRLGAGPAGGFNGRAAFLADTDEVYFKTILRRSLESTEEALEEGLGLLEIEFPPIRANDPTSAGTFDASAAFVREFIKADVLASLGAELFVVFPERSEKKIAEKKWGGTPCTITSTDCILENDTSLQSIQPKVLVVVAPGFNIPEYTDIAKFEQVWEKCPTIIVINGYLSRLRAGFYPALLYPGLAKVTKSFYSRFTSILTLSPLAVVGDRLGCWIARVYPSAWEVLLKTSSDDKYDVILESEGEPDSKKTWKMATQLYKDRTGKLF